MAVASCGGSAKPLSASVDRGLEQVGPRQPALAPVRELQHAQHARHADRPAAERGVEEVDRLAVRVEEQVGAGILRRGLAPVERARACASTPSQCSRNAPPPMPEDCGSTRPSTAWAAIAASTALPPWRRIARRRLGRGGIGGRHHEMAAGRLRRAGGAAVGQDRLRRGCARRRPAGRPASGARAPQPGSAPRTRRSSVMLEPSWGVLSGFRGERGSGRAPNSYCAPQQFGGRWPLSG